MTNTSVDDWLRSLGLLNYVQAFIDNGYDDLDICKQIGDEDLDAIGVINAKDRKEILASVQSLKSQGVNAVYFELEAEVEPTVPKYVTQTDREKYSRDELINKMKSLLDVDNCVLQNNPSAEHDPLDDLAQYYADQLYTYFQDVKEVLEYLRDGETNEGVEHSSPRLPKKKNAKLLQESKGLSKSLNSLDTNAVKGKGQKSPKHGISRLFSNKKKNSVTQPPKISGPVETAIITSNVQMSDEDRKSLMLKVKHGDITQEEALTNFWSYEATHVKDQEKDKTNEKKDAKKKKGIFSRSSFKRRSSGHSSEILAADISLGEKDRVELMRKIRDKEITTEEAWNQLRRFGSKRDSKTKSPKITRKGSSKSPKDKSSRISASSMHLSSSTFYDSTGPDFSQSTSNIPSIAGSDSSPDSTPGLSRRLELKLSHRNSVEQFGSNGSIELDPKNAANYSAPRKASPVAPKGSSSPKMMVNELRRAVSDKRSSKDQVEANRRSTTLPNSNRSSNSSLNESVESLTRQSPTPPGKKPPRGPTGKPSIATSTETKAKPDLLPKRTGSNELEGKKPVLPPKPRLPAKPPKPPLKPQRPSLEEKNSLSKKTLASLANGVSNENVNNTGIGTKAEVTSGDNVVTQERVPPPRPSPQTRVSRHKPSGTKLLEMIEKKLDEEGIDLSQEPYSKQDGKWGVPMALIDRYSCELQSTMREVTKEMDHIRIEKLNHVKKKATPCDLSNLRFTPDVVGKLSSVVDWLTSLGLPMYIDNLIEEGYNDMDTIPYLSEEHLNYANITKPEHTDRLIRSLENMAPDTKSCNGD